MNQDKIIKTQTFVPNMLYQTTTLLEAFPMLGFNPQVRLCIQNFNYCWPGRPFIQYCCSLNGHGLSREDQFSLVSISWHQDSSIACKGLPSSDVALRMLSSSSSTMLSNSSSSTSQRLPWACPQSYQPLWFLFLLVPFDAFSPLSSLDPTNPPSSNLLLSSPSSLHVLPFVFLV